MAVVFLRQHANRLVVLWQYWFHWATATLRENKREGIPVLVYILLHS